MLFLFAGGLWLDHQRLKRVVTPTPAEHLLHLLPVVLLQSRTGHVALHAPLNLAPDQTLVREERQRGRDCVCDVLRTQCAEIARANKH